MYGNEMFGKGVYGIKDLETDSIIYVGSTNTSFITRWGYHAKDIRYGVHCNKKLVELFEKGNFEFVILEAGEFTSKELLKKEKEYTSTYGAVKNGYCIHVGGGSLKKASVIPNTNFEVDDNIKELRLYIEKNWYNKKIYKEDRIFLIKHLKKHGIETPKFMVTLRKLGFVVQRFADKQSWIITDKTY